MIRLRRPRKDEVDPLARLIASETGSGFLLPRTREDIERNLAHFVVAVKNGDGPPRIVGCGALRPYTPRLAEVRSLCVASSARGNGLGVRIVRALLLRARRREIHRVFALTQSPEFFEGLRFRSVEIDSLPEKIWTDCAACPRQDDCPEVPVLRVLEDRR